jgi:WD40 repeat protein
VAQFADPSGNYGVNSVAWSEDGRYLAAGDDSKRGITYLWDMSDGKVQEALIDPHGLQVQAVAFSPNGTILAVADADRSIYLWPAPR